MIKLKNGNTIETIESDEVVCRTYQIGLYDRISSYEFNSDIKYYSSEYNFGKLIWKPIFDINADVILEQSIADNKMWVVIKLFKEMRDDIKDLLENNQSK